MLVFLPLFALTGIEGRLFAPLGVAYIVSILCSLLVGRDRYPGAVLLAAAWMRRMHAGDGALVRWLEAGRTDCYAGPSGIVRWCWGCGRRRALAAASVAFLPRAFLPPFNEGTLVINITYQPGYRWQRAMRWSRGGTPVDADSEVGGVGRRTGRAELDEHPRACIPPSSTLTCAKGGRPRAAVLADIRGHLASLPPRQYRQPISHRLDHMLSRRGARRSREDLRETTSTRCARWRRRCVGAWRRTCRA